MTTLDVNNMVLNDINVELVTNSDKTGVFDKLMDSVNRNIDEQYIDNRITGSDYANVYLGSLQSVLGQSIQFVLQEQLNEAQVGSLIKDNDIKAKQYELACIEVENKRFEVDNLLPEQLIKMQEEIDLLQTQDSEALLDGVKNRLLKDADISMKAKQEDLVDSQILGSGFDNDVKSEQVQMSIYERVTVQPKKLEKLQEEIDLLQTQDSELLLNGVKDRLLKDSDISMKVKQEDLIDSQILGSGFDNTLKSEQATMSTYERLTVQPKKLEKLQEEIDMLQSQDVEVIAGTVRADLESTSKIALTTEQIETEALNNGVDGMIENQILKIKEDVLVSIEQVKIAKTNTATEQANSIANIDKVLGYNYTLDADSNIVVGTTTGDGKLDYEKLLIKEQTESEDIRNKVDGVLENQILDIKKGVDIKSAQLVSVVIEDTLKTNQGLEILDSTIRSNTKLDDDLLTTAKQRTLLDTEEELKQFEATSINPEKLIKIQEEIDMLQTQDSEALLDGVKNRLIKDADISMKAKQESLIDSQIIGDGFDNDVKSEQALMSNYERITMQPKKLEKLQEEIDILQTQDSELLLDGVKKRLIMDEEVQTSDLQQIILATEEEIKTEQLGAMYTDRVLKDKQAAKLGLDNVMKNSEASKDSDSAFIYIPNYVPGA